VPSLKKMRSRTDDIKVEWGEETTVVTWRPGLLTDNFLQRLAAVYDEAISTTGGSARAMGRVRAHLAELIAGWDLTQDEGPMDPKTNPMVPINEESLGEIPEGLLLRITKEILEEAQGGEASGSSGDGGPAGAPSDTSHDGPHSFS
jgi:hypothetical protein